MKHAVYASIMRQPYGLVELFTNRQKAKETENRIKRDGLKYNGVFFPAKTKIVLKETL